ncbi:hypothetical protein BDQ17DRAFT_1360609 [Cyathus striatus]|nr:hypothetical protein BDQ17DRAFT_1360609 [Cyathus striatus]
MAMIFQLVAAGSKEARDLRTFMLFLVKLCAAIDGRITVVVDLTAGDTSGRSGKIISAALWMPPKKRVSIMHVIGIFRCGVVKVVKAYGLNGLMRIGFEYGTTCEKALHAGYKDMEIKESPEESWYLQLIGTDSEYRNRGVMSLLMREAYAHAPLSYFLLEATTTASRDKYGHLGFKLVKPIYLGRGKANSKGLKASGKDASGIEIYGMVKYPESEMSQSAA